MKKTLAILLLICLLIGCAPAQRAAIAPGYFSTSNGVVYDPAGQPFIFKGVSQFYGTFSGGDAKNYGVPRISYNIAVKSLPYIKSIGVNTIRIFTSVPGTAYHTTEYLSWYGTVDKYKLELDNTIKLTRAAGFYVEISPAHNADVANTVAWLSYLGATYKDDPGILIGTMNEPKCAASGSYYDWACWQSDHLQYIKALRDAGYVNPIIVDSINWSSDLSKISQYSLGDDNLIYAVHRYGNDNETLTDALKADYNAKWANQAATYPMFIEEVGQHNGYLDSIVWMGQFIDWSTDWVINRGGDGIIAFTWYWSDGNKMTNYDPPLTDAGLNEWGLIFKTKYLDKVNGVEPVTPVPTTITPVSSNTPTKTIQVATTPVPATNTAVIVPTITRTPTRTGTPNYMATIAAGIATIASKP